MIIKLFRLNKDEANLINQIIYKQYCNDTEHQLNPFALLQ